MRHWPIRLRLALAFAVAAAAVLVAIGAVLTLRLGSTLDELVNDGLETRSAELAPRVARGEDVVAGQPVDPGERMIQILDDEGAVVAGTTGFRQQPVASPGVLASLRSGERFEADVQGIDGRARILATRVDTRGGPRLVLVGQSLEDRGETVRGFLVILGVIGPVALVVVSLLGWAVTTAALRPVERMRREAEAISGNEPGRRLSLPPARDEIQRLGATLNDMLDRLETALEHDRAFVASASHELRTPLALLTTELELALRRPRSEAELAASLRAAAAEADRLARLADDLLLLARADRRRLPVHREQLPARGLLERVAERLSGLASARERRVSVDGPESLTLTGDSLLLEQALGNLLENALRHGGGEVRLDAVERYGNTELHVVDGGGGFPEDFLPHAFERFSRADEARSGEGTGLGLTIAAAIAAAHGGSIHATNRAGGGADVWVSIPVGGTGGIR
jgi:heavy metal sensor kinase